MVATAACIAVRAGAAAIAEICFAAAIGFVLINEMKINSDVKVSPTLYEAALRSYSC